MWEKMTWSSKINPFPIEKGSFALIHIEKKNWMPDLIKILLVLFCCSLNVMLICKHTPKDFLKTQNVNIFSDKTLKIQQI